MNSLDFSNFVNGIMLTGLFFVLLFFGLVITSTPLSSGPVKFKDSDLLDEKQQIAMLKSELDALPAGAENVHEKALEWKKHLRDYNEKHHKLLKKRRSPVTLYLLIKYNKWVVWSWLLYSLGVAYVLERMVRCDRYVYVGILALPSLVTVYSLVI